MDRAAPFTRIVNGVTPHFVTRQIYCGAGKVGSETAIHDGERGGLPDLPAGRVLRGAGGPGDDPQAPIVNTRDEPHADPHRYRRLHVIVGDANLAEVATFLKVGTTSLVLAMIEDDVTGSRSLQLADPVTAMHEVAWTGPSPVRCLMADGSTATALAIQWELFSLARKYADDRGSRLPGGRVDRRGRAHPLGGGPPRPGDRPDVAGPPARLGGQAPADRGLPGPARVRMGRPPAGRTGSPVPRPAAGAVPVRPSGHRAPGRRGARWRPR